MKNSASIFLGIAIILLPFAPVRIASAQDGTVSISPASAKTGQSFTLTAAGENFSIANNVIRYYDSSGILITQETVSSGGSYYFTYLTPPVDNNITIYSYFPVLEPGDYYLTITREDGVQIGGEVSFTITEVDSSNRIILVGGIGGLTELQKIDLYEPLTEELGIDVDSVLLILTENLMPAVEGAADFEVKVGGYPAEIITSEFGLITEIPPGITGNVPVHVKVNNYNFDPVNINISTASSYAIQTPSPGAGYTGGESVDISWIGDKNALLGLIKGAGYSEITSADAIPITTEDTADSPYEWIIPEEIETRSDYRIGMLIYDGPSVEELEEYFENYEQETEVLSMFVQIVISDPAFSLKKASHPVGTLINDMGSVYLITEDGRSGFPSVPVFRSHGHHFSDIVLANESDQELSAGPTMKFSDGSLMVDNSAVYILYDGKKYGFTSKEVFDGLGYSWSNVYPGDLSAYAYGGTIDNPSAAHSYGTLVNINGAVFINHPDGRVGVPSMAIASSHKLRFERTVPGNTADLGLPVKGNLDFASGSILNAEGTVYIVEEHSRKAFPDARTFWDRGYSFDNSIKVSKAEIAHLTELKAYQSSPAWLVDETYTNSRDAKRTADVRQIQTGLELYYNDYGYYPFSLNSLSGDYMAVVPTAPLPVDGSCTQAQNTYFYVQLESGQSYTLSFCLGGEVGGYGPGVHTATPGGILGARVENEGLLQDLIDELFQIP